MTSCGCNRWDGGDPIQLTHNSDSVVEGAAFFPDGKRILYAVVRADQTKNTIEVISTLGGEPRC
jgi:tricorn protease-like protein